MSDLTARLAGLSVPSPIFVGAGPNTRTIKSCMEAFEAGAGAVEIWGPPVFESSTAQVRLDEIQFLPHGKSVSRNEIYGLASTGLRRTWAERESGWKYRVKLVRTLKKETHGVGAVVASIGYVRHRLTDDLGRGWGEMAKMSEDAGADAVSLHLQTGQDLAGKILTDNPERLPGIIAECKRDSSLPVIAKIPIEGCDPAALSKMAFDAGADAVAPTGRYVGLNIDIESESVPDWSGFHGYGGPWALPITVAWMAKIRRAGMTGEVIPGGGANSWEDLVRLLLTGATMVQVCTWPIAKGYGVLKSALGRMQRWMSDKGYDSIDAFRGRALANLVDPSEIWGRFLENGPFENVHVDPDRCTGCRACLNPCYFEAIAIGKDRKAHVDPEKCSGCGCCYHICPEDAILATHAEPIPVQEPK